jgi:hypothetical protein
MTMEKTMSALRTFNNGERNPNFKHGKSHTRVERIRSGMVQRCCNPNNKNFKEYGARGITVCEAWKSNPLTFYIWAEENGYQEDLTIERIDNDGNYEPDNCRWATRKEQSTNKNDNHFLIFNGISKTISQWSEETGIPAYCIRDRLTREWSIEKILTSRVEDKHINRKNNHFLTLKGETKTITQWENQYGFSHGTIRGRINRGNSVIEALNPQKRHNKKE